MLELHRQQLLNSAGLLFLFGAAVGFLHPFYSVVDRISFLNVFVSALPSFLFETAISLSAAILCISCYWSLRRERLGLASIRGIVAAALLIVTDVWPASLLVLGAAVIASLYQTR